MQGGPMRVMTPQMQQQMNMQQQRMQQHHRMQHPQMAIQQQQRMNMMRQAGPPASVMMQGQQMGGMPQGVPRGPMMVGGPGRMPSPVHSSGGMPSPGPNGPNGAHMQQMSPRPMNPNQSPHHSMGSQNSPQSFNVTSPGPASVRPAGMTSPMHHPSSSPLPSPGQPHAVSVFQQQYG